MFPITEAWNGYEIDDAVLEEYDASVMEMSPGLLRKAAHRAVGKVGNEGSAYQAHKFFHKMHSNEDFPDSKQRAAEHKQKMEEAKRQGEKHVKQAVKFDMAEKHKRGFRNYTERDSVNYLFGDMYKRHKAEKAGLTHTQNKPKPPTEPPAMALA